MISWVRGFKCPDCNAPEAMLGHLAGEPFVWACYECGGASKVLN